MVNSDREWDWMDIDWVDEVDVRPPSSNNTTTLTED